MVSITLSLQNQAIFNDRGTSLIGMVVSPKPHQEFQIHLCHRSFHHHTHEETCHWLQTPAPPHCHGPAVSAHRHRERERERSIAHLYDNGRDSLKTILRYLIVRGPCSDSLLHLQQPVKSELKPSPMAYTISHNKTQLRNVDTY